MLQKLLFLLFVSMLLSACWYTGSRRDLPLQKVWGYKPVYSHDERLLRIWADTPQPVRQAGKIYSIGQLVLQNEVGKGLHFFNRSQPQQMENLGFVHILGNTELSIKGNMLYANSFADLVVIDISNWRTPIEVKRIKNAFQQSQHSGYAFALPPPEKNVYFECIQADKGIHTGWVRDSVVYNCYY